MKGEARACAPRLTVRGDNEACEVWAFDGLSDSGMNDHASRSGAKATWRSGPERFENHEDIGFFPHGKRDGEGSVATEGRQRRLQPTF